MTLLRSIVLALGLTLAGAGLCQGLQPCPDAWAKPEPPEPPPDQNWTFTAGPYVLHWQHDPAHTYAFVFALERRVAGNRLCGLSAFRNSFGQPSVYAYLGQRWDNIRGNPDLSLKVTAGIIYGYVGEHRDKVPLNWKGYSPVIIPSLVYKFDDYSSLDVMVLGTAGLVFAYSQNF